MSFRFRPTLNTLLEPAAERKNRCLMNTVGMLFFACCKQRGIEVEAAVAK
jgi:hypothetical protein